VADDDQLAILLESLALSTYSMKVSPAHRVLQSLRFERTAINDRFALGVFVDTLTDGLFRRFRMDQCGSAPFTRLRQVTLDFDSILQRT
jgi:hypothetical protein